MGERGLTPVPPPLGGVAPSTAAGRQPYRAHSSGIDPVGTDLRSPSCRTGIAARCPRVERGTFRPDYESVACSAVELAACPAHAGMVHSMSPPRFTGPHPIRGPQVPPPVALTRRPASSISAVQGGVLLGRAGPARGYRSIPPTHVWIDRRARLAFRSPAARTQARLGPASPRAHEARCTARRRSRPRSGLASPSAV